MTNRNVHRKRERCRICGNRELWCFLSLGPSPLANAFLESPDAFDAEPFFPLDVYLCTECGLVQLLDVIDPEVLFRDYIYVTGTSATMAEHNRRYAEHVVELLELTPDDLVVEVASNDGSLLKHFAARGIRVLGVEPARNIASLARSAGIETVDEFFNAPVATGLRAEYGPAKAVIADNVLAHVDDTRDFLVGCRTLLAPDGLVVIEVPYLGDLLDRLEYDTVYHEHLCYFSVSALMRACEAAGLSVRRIEHLEVHGGSLRLFAGLWDRQPAHSREAQEWAERESRLGLTSCDRYRRFASEVEENRRSLRALLEKLCDKGMRLAAYGAPAKGNTLLNYCRIGPDILEFVVDKNEMKVGRYTPGRHIPVLPVSVVLERQPDYLLILPWNIAEEIMRQQSEYQRRGGRFILPIPEPRVVEP
ncbi:MAG: class I SAM-dependent methyltransferase [Candidatus Dadabacteria bacterium]|nr:MAG: class I SAM-dependent methyltransferase [Candidatus Dadabacteria bacterium]